MLASILLTVLVFAGSVGLPLYSHSCTAAGETHLSVGYNFDECNDHEKSVSDAPSCCQESDQIDNHDCCSESVNRLALSFPAHDHWNLTLSLPAPATRIIWRFVSEEIPVNDIPASSKGDFFWKTTSQYLSTICIWRI